MVSVRGRGGGYVLCEDGARFSGDRYLGAEPVLGEAVFNTSHSGYQEILTDPSYLKQIMVFTAPHIGNVGVNDVDLESEEVHVAGAVTRSLSPRPSSWRAKGALDAWMDDAGAPLLCGVDTRAVTLHLREAGAMRAGLFPAGVDVEEALEQVLGSPSMAGADLASGAGCAAPFDLGPEDALRGLRTFRPRDQSGEGLRVGVLDLGIKRSIIEELLRRGCAVRVLPSSTPAREIIDSGFDGVLLSNGPGDPAATMGPLDTVGALLDHCLSSGSPLFGICLGHQLLSLAAGLETFKLPFGHRGANHPVRRQADGVVEITSQNHGFAVEVEPDDALSGGMRLTHINLNDGTVEGIAHEEAPIFSIQYHPEASPGPHDGLSYFDRFIELMRAHR